MPRERKYQANYDDGHDYGFFYYWSSHRNKSDANLEDAKRTFINKFGYSRWRQVFINETYLCKE